MTRIKSHPTFKTGRSYKTRWQHWCKQAVVAAWLTFSMAAGAVTIFGNTPPGEGGGFLGTNDIFSTQWNAAQFTLGAQDYSLDSIVVFSKAHPIVIGGDACQMFGNVRMGVTRAERRERVSEGSY